MTSTSINHTLILGAGVFGLSTALALLHRQSTPSHKLTILDSSPTLPNPSGSSVDSSRIIRADYANPAYARLALEAQTLWRDRSSTGWGGGGRYHEPGFLLTADGGKQEYLWKAMENVVGLGSRVERLETRERVREASGYEGVSGDCGYVNWGSGWADAELCVKYALGRVREVGGGRVNVRSGCRAVRLLFDEREGRCKGVELEGGEVVEADLTILATGAWSGTLIDLRGRAVATGQALAYIDITEEEQGKMGDRPTIMNMSRGMFVIPPSKRELKVARHGFGYRNLKKIQMLGGRKANRDGRNGEVNGAETIEVSVPEVGSPIPIEAEKACRDALREVVPEMADRKFTRTRICWYCDTPDGDFLMDHHPDHPDLFVATGGSGHGFKFFPVIGEKIVDVLERKPSEYAQLWRWKEGVSDFAFCDDGSRSGEKGMLLNDEMARPRF